MRFPIGRTRFANWGVKPLESSVTILAAAFDFRQVRLFGRGLADCAQPGAHAVAPVAKAERCGGNNHGGAGGYNANVRCDSVTLASGACPAHPSVVGPSATYAPRRVIHPEPRYDRRPIIHTPPVEKPTPWYPEVGGERPRPVCPVCSPVQPPWAVLPWDAPTPVELQVKLIQQVTDVISKGSLIDLFI